LTASATATVVVADIAVYGDSSDYLVDQLSRVAGLSSHGLIKLTSLSSLTNVGCLIVNKAGDGWSAQGASANLTLAEANQIKAFWESGKPVFIAHDSLPADVFAVLYPALIGTGSQVRVTLAQTSAFALTTTGPGAGSEATVTAFNEIFCNGFTQESGTPVVTTTFSPPSATASTLSLIVARTTGTKALISGEAIYHVFGGEGSPETQWWETNQPLVTALVTWLAL